MSPAAEAGPTSIRVRTGAWYGDEDVPLSFPTDWSVTCHWPRTPKPVSDEQIAEALERPVGQPPVRELARGSSRPLVIVDDLTRPTPASRILPLLLRQFEVAGIAPREVSVLLATGAHGPPQPGAIEKKIGPAATSCRVLAHEHRGNVARVGRTSFGTPVWTNRDVMASDFVVGVGGVYPQHSTGFGGGSKLALGVLGIRSIVKLHYGHPSVGGTYRIDNDFRRDLDEIARMIGLRTIVTAHVDAQRELVRVVSGDHLAYYDEAARFGMDAFRAPPPGDADVVIANAYPVDVSLTFVRSKGMIPTFEASPAASRVVVAACSEGAGRHDLFPFVGGSRFQRQIHLARVALSRPGTLPRKAVARLTGALRAGSTPPPEAGGDRPAGPRRNAVWLYTPHPAPPGLPAHIPGMTATGSWDRVVDAVRMEQGGRSGLAVVVYPCAPIQVLDRTG